MVSVYIGSDWRIGYVAYSIAKCCTGSHSTVLNFCILLFAKNRSNRTLNHNYTPFRQKKTTPLTYSIITCKYPNRFTNYLTVEDLFWANESCVVTGIRFLWNTDTRNVKTAQKITIKALSFLTRYKWKQCWVNELFQSMASFFLKCPRSGGQNGTRKF